VFLTTFSLPVEQLLAHVVALLKSVNTSAGVNQLLLTGEERMALRADFYSDVLLGRACRDLVTASASDYSSFVYGMNTFFHEFHLNPYMPNPGLLTISGSDLGIVITIIYSITTF
jgi:hypothetical protein